MKTEISKNALRVLHWSVGLVVLVESRFYSPSERRRNGLQPQRAAGLVSGGAGGGEIVAALLFLG